MFHGASSQGIEVDVAYAAAIFSQAAGNLTEEGPKLKGVIFNA
jgi:hypothetical protein